MSLFHPRNRHTGRYDFDRLYAACPKLKTFTRLNPAGRYTIDFADPTAVKLLNSAILKADYGVEYWDIPDNFLCPPIPGRADYIHFAADLLNSTSHSTSTEPTRVLDIGVGANVIYPLIGHAEYAWHFIGSEIDPRAITAARKNINANKLQDAIEIRHQSNAHHIFNSIIKKDDYYALSICNPPFFQSEEQAHQQNQRKWKNLGKKAMQTRNFGGQSNELWCEGGEVTFISRMIQESAQYKNQVQWFTTLVSREAILPALIKQLRQLRIKDVEVIDMAQGQKRSRFLAWCFA